MPSRLYTDLEYNLVDVTVTFRRDWRESIVDLLHGKCSTRGIAKNGREEQESIARTI
jgi:hypothetical protein